MSLTPVKKQAAWEPEDEAELQRKAALYAERSAQQWAFVPPPIVTPEHDACPFCGSTEQEIDETDDYSVFCHGCAARGPEAGTEAGAWNGWNKRHKKTSEGE